MRNFPLTTSIVKRNLRHYRKEAGLTTAEASRISGVPIRRLERAESESSDGISIELETLIVLCKCYSITLDEAMELRWEK